ncbi:type 4 pilus major pilin [Bordetella bronchiseptica]|uniref:type 4 pilus major pilin n=1 Tax=Bordetella bronchiseptica TaxID=518 RepID=UPI00028B48E4|nr:type 4 pilus major pilin [Bordetella bronchiseptica]AWP58300.1 prepilin-type cleavage/methylation domain-containing protein [Bordetella bronchiseptica]AZW30596.1 prepilin-type cleavage/methylation domain-containing protein [Bordetella bronchiseptica]KAK79796.1 prepilin-type cleavage/methylation N-terminal domain protein [Bordetella bronchiseptica CA90 BB02]KCV44894.1 prepilin-type cleavage/methylation N-terminal domain protein [Bordetella bronchiseptica 345]KCV56126.1 prepilin-type cleavage
MSRTILSGRQAGFSLVEVSIVTAIVLLVAIIGIPAIGSYVIESKVPRVGEELQRFVARTKANAQGDGAAPYTGIGTASLAHALRDSSVVSVRGEGASATVAHGLGGQGAGAHGVISVAPAAPGGAPPGSAFTLTLTNVNGAACPALASVMQRVSDIIAVQGKAGPVVVKNALAVPALPYRAQAAQAQCVAGDRNTFVFTAR